MELVHLTLADRGGLEKLLDEFNEQVRKKQIKPELIEYLRLDEVEEVGPDSGLMVARERRLFAGILLYQLLRPKNFDELGIMLMRISNDFLTDSNRTLVGVAQLSKAEGFKGIRFIGAVAYVHLTESFKKRAGIAKALIGEVRQMPHVEGIILQPSLPETVPIYERLGFHNSGIYTTGMDTPIMAMTNR